MPLANLRVITSPFNPLIVLLALSIMDSSGRRTSPGQSDDTIGIAPLPPPPPPDLSAYLHKTNSQSDNPDPWYERKLLREGPYLIADYLAQNSSKSAAVFRRYDKLAIHRLIVLSRELRGFEKAHDRRVDHDGDLESMEDEQDSDQFGPAVLEYCTRLLHILTIEAAC